MDKISKERISSLRPLLSAWAAENLTPSRTKRGNTVCPLCNSSGGGHIKGQTYSCFSCGAQRDLVGLVMSMRTCTFPAAVAALEAWAGAADISTPSEVQAARQGQEKRRKPHSLEIVERRPLSDSPEAKAYLEGRGLLHLFADQLGVQAGRDRAGRQWLLWPCRRYEPKAGELVSCTYARTVDGEARAWIGGTGLLLCGIDRPGPVWVCEGQEDALAVYIYGRPAISLGGTSGAARLLELLEARPAALMGRRFMLMLDDDSPGRRAALRLADALEARAIPWTIAPYSMMTDAGKDPNELLRQGMLSDLLARF